MSARYPVVVSKFTYLFGCKFELTMEPMGLLNSRELPARAPSPAQPALRTIARCRAPSGYRER